MHQSERRSEIETPNLSAQRKLLDLKTLKVPKKAKKRLLAKTLVLKSCSIVDPHRRQAIYGELLGLDYNHISCILSPRMDKTLDSRLR